MKLCNTLGIFLLFSFFISCNSDDDAKPTASTCKPKSLVVTHSGTFDSVQFIYTSSGKLDKLLYFDANKVFSTDQLEYDGQAKVIKFTRQYSSYDKPYNTYHFKYNSADRVEKIDMWGFDTHAPAFVTSVTYDTKGRLSTMTDVFNETRYEYNEDDNVSKIFYKSFYTEQTTLGRENLSFDDHIRFFANVPELVLLNTCVFKYEPSKNNVTSTVVHMPNSGVFLGAPENLTFNLKYDANGMVINNFLPYDYTFDGLIEINFKDFKYYCQ